LEVLDDDLLVAVHPSGTANQEEREGIHEAIIPSAHNGDQHFVAERPLGLARKDPHSKSLNVVRVFGQYGGKVVSPPFDVPEVGRIVVVLDPQGAAIGLFKPAA
jgi:hypothetical protein